MRLATRPRHPVDPHRYAQLVGPFAPTVEEIDVPDLTIEGHLPPEINGDYIRNGPNPRFRPLGGYSYPFDGDGMLHRVQIREGKARYTNRFVRTPGLVAEEAAGHALWSSGAASGDTPGADLVGPNLAHTRKDLPGINVVSHAGRLLALAESKSPFLVSVELDTLDRETFGGAIPMGTTAHPKVDPTTGEMVLFCYSPTAPYLTWSVIDRDGRPTRAQTVIPGVDRPTVVHDMALTSTYVVLVVAPLFVNVGAGIDGEASLSWEPEHGTRIVMIPRDGSSVRWIHTDPFWMWHAANAYDTPDPSGRGQSVVQLDLVAWSGPRDRSPAPATAQLIRLSLNPQTGEIRRSVLVDRPMEYPRIDDRALTCRHRIIGTTLTTRRNDLAAGDNDSLGWFDHQTSQFTHWHAGTLAVGEQSYIPKPGDLDSTSGWWTTLAVDRTDYSSRLLVIPAADPTSGPVAVVHLPRRVPLGMHGNWMSTQQ